MKDDAFATACQRMVAEQIVRRGIRSQKVIDSLIKVPRHLFVPADQIMRSYDDGPLPIGHGQTISQPYIVAYMTEKLVLSGKEKVLEIGTGSGYQTAVLAENAAVVYTVEIVPELSRNAKKILTDELHYTNIFYKIGRGQEGWVEYMPYDRIMLTASPESVPESLFHQLVDNGILLGPEGNFFQKLCRYWKRNDQIEKEELIGVSFVPLVEG